MWSTADTQGWVSLQFYAGQAWVPDAPKKITSLPVTGLHFPYPDPEDSMLCPECVKKNKRMMEKLINYNGEGEATWFEHNHIIPFGLTMS